MKNLLPLLLLIVSFFNLISCSDESEDNSPSACINASKNNVEVGEKVKITNCSKNFKSIEYSYFDSQQQKLVTVTTPDIEVSFPKPGDHLVGVKVFGENGETNSSSITITVNDFEENLFFINIPNDFESIPLGAGIDAITGRLYYIDLLGSNSSGRAYYYKELDNDFKQISQVFLRDETENTGSATRFLLTNGDKIINTVNTLLI